MELLSTKYRKKAMLKAMERTLGNVLQSTKLVGISRSTHYNWLSDDKGYQKQIKEVKESALDLCEAVLFQLIADKNTQATIFYLKCKGKVRGYGQEISEIKHDPYKTISDEELKAIIGI